MACGLNLTVTVAIRFELQAQFIVSKLIARNLLQLSTSIIKRKCVFFTMKFLNKNTLHLNAN